MQENQQIERIKALMPELDARYRALNETLKRAEVQGIEDYELDIAVADVKSVLKLMSPVDPDYVEWLEEKAA
jgi:hypothetical protein